MKSKTTKDQLDALRAERQRASEAYQKYLKEYNTEHGGGRTVIKEIIELHQAGLSNKEIVEKGYNKHTVSGNVRLFKKGKRVAKTVVSKYLPEKEKKDKKFTKQEVASHDKIMSNRIEEMDKDARHTKKSLKK